MDYIVNGSEHPSMYEFVTAGIKSEHKATYFLCSGPRTETSHSLQSVFSYAKATDTAGLDCLEIGIFFLLFFFLKTVKFILL